MLRAHYAPTLRRLFAVGLIILSAAPGSFSAAPVATESPVEFTRLDLADGRRLKNVVVKTYNASTDTVLVVADGRAMTIPLKLVPATFQAQLKGAPVSGQNMTIIATPKVIPPSAPAGPMVTFSVAPASTQYSGSRPQTLVQDPNQPGHWYDPRYVRQVAVPTRLAPPARSPTPQPAVDPLEAQRAVAQAQRSLQQHQSIALKHVDYYYRYEHRLGSNNISVSRIDFENDQPQPVTGWAGRYRTEGKVFIEFYDSKGGSQQRTTGTFEVLTEEKPDGQIKVEQFIRKS